MLCYVPSVVMCLFLILTSPPLIWTSGSIPSNLEEMNVTSPYICMVDHQNSIPIDENTKKAIASWVLHVASLSLYYIYIYIYVIIMSSSAMS